MTVKLLSLGIPEEIWLFVKIMAMFSYFRNIF